MRNYPRTRGSRDVGAGEIPHGSPTLVLHLMGAFLEEPGRDSWLYLR